LDIGEASIEDGDNGSGGASIGGRGDTSGALTKPTKPGGLGVGEVEDVGGGAGGAEGVTVDPNKR